MLLAYVTEASQQRHPLHIARFSGIWDQSLKIFELENV